MLDKEVFFNKMDELVMYFPSWKLNIEEVKVMKLWYSQFEHMDDDRFKYMINQYIKGGNFNPTVKGLLDCDNIPRKSKDQLKHEQMLRDNGLL